MCTGVEIALLAAAAAGTAYTVYSTEKQSEDAAEQAGIQAAQVSDSAKQQAKNIRELGRRTLGESTAALAAGGVDVKEGSGLLVQEEIVRDTEADAFSTIAGANREARSIRKGGKNAAAGYRAQAVSALGGFAQQAGGRWKRSPNAVQPQVYQPTGGVGAAGANLGSSSSMNA